MSRFRTAIEWRGNGNCFADWPYSSFADWPYSQVRAWRFDGDFPLPAHSSLHVASFPRLNLTQITPKEAFVASLSGGHMLCFLELASRMGYILEYYTDVAEASLSYNASGSPWVAHVLLQPAILFTGTKVPTDADVLDLHRAAHAECPLANSVGTKVETLGVWHHQPGIGGGNGIA